MFLEVLKLMNTVSVNKKDARSTYSIRSQPVLEFGTVVAPHVFNLTIAGF